MLKDEWTGQSCSPQPSNTTGLPLFGTRETWWSLGAGWVPARPLLPVEADRSEPK
jgi:hypothetical protein